jgi:hypothetical protein
LVQCTPDNTRPDKMGSRGNMNADNLVMVKCGKKSSEHAFLVSDSRDVHDEDGNTLVRVIWLSTEESDWVKEADIEMKALRTHRNRRTPAEATEALEQRIKSEVQGKQYESSLSSAKTNGQQLAFEKATERQKTRSSDTSLSNLDKKYDKTVAKIPECKLIRRPQRRRKATIQQKPSQKRNKRTAFCSRSSKRSVADDVLPNLKTIRPSFTHGGPEMGDRLVLPGSQTHRIGEVVGESYVYRRGLKGESTPVLLFSRVIQLAWISKGGIWTSRNYFEEDFGPCKATYATKVIPDELSGLEDSSGILIESSDESSRSI